MKDIIASLLEIELPDNSNFLKVKETLTRIGVASTKTKTLYQSCHILHKKGLYYIVHFKEMFQLDGKDTQIAEEDIYRRNRIASLLDEWNLIRVKDRALVLDKDSEMRNIAVIPFIKKDEWTLKAKYTVGKKK